MYCKNNMTEVNNQLNKNVNELNKCRFCSKPVIMLIPKLDIKSQYCEYHDYCAENGDYDNY